MVLSFRDGDLEFVIFIRKDFLVMFRVIYLEFKMKYCENYEILENVGSFWYIRDYLVEKGW